MTKRPGWRWLAASLIAGTLGVGGMLAWAEPPKPAGNDESLRHEIEDLAKIMLFRVDEANADEPAEPEKEAPKPAMTDAQRSATVAAAIELASLALREYKDGTYPLELATLESELTLAREDFERCKVRKAWDDKEMASGRTTVKPVDYQKDVYALQRAEILFKQTESRLDVLKKFTHPREVARLQAAVDAAESAAHPKPEPARPLAARPRGRPQRFVSHALTDAEKSAISRLDEAMRLRDAGDLAESKVMLREADRLWRDSEPSRIARRYAELKGRIHRSAESARGR